MRRIERDPGDRRPLLGALMKALCVEHLQGDRIFAGDDLVERPARAAIFDAGDVLLGEAAQIVHPLVARRMLGEHKTDEAGRRPNSNIGAPGHLALPLRIEEIVPGLGDPSPCATSSVL